MMPVIRRSSALPCCLLALTQVTAGTYECSGSDSSLTKPLQVGVSEDDKTTQDFEVPAMSTDPKDYSYALENAFVLLPTRCLEDLEMEPNVGDSNGEVKQWMGRMEDLRSESGKDDFEAVLSGCACGWVLFVHGSGGFNYDNTRYSTNMAASGYGVIAPDSFASDKLGLRYRAGIPNLAAKLREWNSRGEGHHKTYWCDDNVYKKDSPCNAAMTKDATHQYPFCYSSDSTAIASHASDWRAYYERVFRLRALELDYIMENLPSYISKANKVFLAGESEGGMVASRYSHPGLEDLIAQGGRIILQWSCEWCYYVSCPEHTAIGSGHAKKSTPILNIISFKDGFFGPKNNSVAWQVARKAGGYGDKDGKGNCYKNLVDNGFQHAYVIKDVGTTYHGLTETSGNMVRSVLLAFMKAPASGPAEYVSHSCIDVETHGGIVLASCGELPNSDGSPGRLTPGSELSCAYDDYKYNLKYAVVGHFEECAKPRSVPSATTLDETTGKALAEPSSSIVSTLLVFTCLTVALTAGFASLSRKPPAHGMKLLPDEPSRDDVF